VALDSPPLEDAARGRAADLLRKAMKLGDLIEQLGGTLAQGSADTRIEGVNSAQRATPVDLTFAENTASAAVALASAAAAVVLRPGGSYLSEKPVIEAANPRLWFARAAQILKPAHAAGAIHPSAVVAATAKLAASVSIGPGVVVEEHAVIGENTRVDAGAVIGAGVCIGANCRIYPRAVLYPGTTLGNRVVIHAGVVLGADGFGYVRDHATGAYTQFPQQGTLVLEDDVEIGANTTIDRGALAETRIRRGAKIDNLVHIGHNCEVGEDVVIAALTGISGSSSVGKGAIIAGQVGIGDHAHVGPGVILGGQAGVLSGKTVTNDGLKPGTVLWGTPARPLMQVLRELATLARLARHRPKDGK
jgi:UDP-3-O-[3-hydroxymyristoyl] glucosamine N-acyltransferase